MKLGGILGSISPAFGMISGQGLFGHAMPFLSPALGLAKALGHHGGGEEEEQPAAGFGGGLSGLSPELLQQIFGQQNGNFLGRLGGRF